LLPDSLRRPDRVFNLVNDRLIESVGNNEASTTSALAWVASSFAGVDSWCPNGVKPMGKQFVIVFMAFAAGLCFTNELMGFDSPSLPFYLDPIGFSPGDSLIPFVTI
jgi:hypothetical protein